MDLDDPTRVKLVELCQSVHRKVCSLDMAAMVVYFLAGSEPLPHQACVFPAQLTSCHADDHPLRHCVNDFSIMLCYCDMPLLSKCLSSYMCVYR